MKDFEAQNSQVKVITYLECLLSNQFRRKIKVLSQNTWYTCTQIVTGVVLTLKKCPICYDHECLLSNGAWYYINPISHTKYAYGLCKMVLIMTVLHTWHFLLSKLNYERYTMQPCCSGVKQDWSGSCVCGSRT